MSRSKKPRKAYRPKPVALDTMAVATHNAGVPAQDERAHITQGLAGSIAALREGRATEHHWSVAAGAHALSDCIENGRIVRGLTALIHPAGEALQAIYHRAQCTPTQWATPTLYAAEIQALRDLAQAHAFQLQQLSRAELLDAVATAQRATLREGHTCAIDTCTCARTHFQAHAQAA